MATFQFAFSSGGKKGNALQVHWRGGWREVPVALTSQWPCCLVVHLVHVP